MPTDEPKATLTGGTGQTAGVGGPPVNRRRLADQVAVELTNQIVKGILIVETKLPNEQDLAEHFDVSKSVIREAVKVVSTRGLLTVNQGIGTVVSPRDRWNLHDPEVMRAMQHHVSLRQFVEARLLLEPELTALAAQRASEEDIAHLKALLDRRQTLDGNQEIALWSLAFHEAIADATQNTVYSFIMSSLRVLMTAKLGDSEHVADRSEEIDRPQPTMEVDHQRIFEAIVERKPDRARALATKHLEQLGPHWEWLSAEHGWSLGRKRARRTQQARGRVGITRQEST